MNAALLSQCCTTVLERLLTTKLCVCTRVLSVAHLHLRRRCVRASLQVQEKRKRTGGDGGQGGGAAAVMRRALTAAAAAAVGVSVAELRGQELGTGRPRAGRR